LNMKSRQCGDTEHANPSWNSGARVDAPPGGREEFFSQRCAVFVFMALNQFAPQHRLPVPGFSLFPLEHHFRPEKKVLVKKIGDPLRELEALEIAASALQVDPQGLKCRLLDELGQCLHHPPRHHSGIKKIRFWQVLEDALKHLTDKGVGERETTVSANSVSFCKLQRYPALHALALNHDDLGVKGRRQGSLENLRQLVRQDL